MRIFEVFLIVFLIIESGVKGCVGVRFCEGQ